MEAVYTYQSSANFINGLQFARVETFSFQRGEEYERKMKLLWLEFEGLTTGAILDETQEARLLELKSLLGTQYLINDKGEFHPSAKKVAKIQKDDPAIARLKSILNTPIAEVPNYLCAPHYRDAIVFYNNSHEIVSVLNVCLGCKYMETKKFNHVEADFETYDLMKRWFIDIGHDVEDPTDFVFDDIKRQRPK